MDFEIKEVSQVILTALHFKNGTSGKDLGIAKYWNLVILYLS